MSIVLDSADYIERSASLPANNAFTIAGWFYMNTATSENGIFHFCNAAGSATICSLRFSNGNGNVFRIFSDGGAANFTATPTTGNWYYIFLRCNGTTAEAGWCDSNYSSFPANNKQTVAQGTAITPGRIQVGANFSYGTAFDSRVFRLSVWDELVSDANLLIAAGTDKGYSTNLNTHIPGTSTGDPARYADTSGNGRNWTASGTIADGADPGFLPTGGGISKTTRLALLGVG